MKDLDKVVHFRFNILKKVISKLAREFGVPEPKLKWKISKGLYGYYAPDMIIVDFHILRLNLAQSVRTVRHEFYHYLQDEFCLDERKSEVKARRFEKDIWANEILPKGQKKLLEVSK